jgi:hypothetical protein
MTTLNTAFQTLLSSVGDLNLNDGDFLKINNLLKKAYDSNTETLTEPINLKIYLKDLCDKTFPQVYIELYELVRDKKCEYNHKPVESINYKVHYENKTTLHSVKPIRLNNVMKSWIQRTRPMKIDIETDDYTTTYTFKTFTESLKQEDAVVDDDEDADFCYDYSVVMGHRFSHEIISPLFYNIANIEY